MSYFISFILLKWMLHSLPNNTLVLSFSSSRGVVSRSRSKPSTPPKGVSPSRIRSTNPIDQLHYLTLLLILKRGERVQP